MKVNKYLLTNNSNSIGTYSIQDKEYALFPDDRIYVNTKPTSMTSNVIVQSFRIEVGEDKVIRKNKIKDEIS